MSSTNKDPEGLFGTIKVGFGAGLVAGCGRCAGGSGHSCRGSWRRSERQCYKEMNIGVARPSTEELKAVRHHFIASHSITENINASYFENWAMEKVQTLFTTKDAVVMVGGTGLYIKAFCEGLDLIPAIEPSIRENIIAQYEKLGLRWLQKEVSVKDPPYWEKGEQKNPQRLMRALEVMLGTGSSILSFQNKKAVERPFKIVKIGLELDRCVFKQLWRDVYDA